MALRGITETKSVMRMMRMRMRMMNNGGERGVCAAFVGKWKNEIRGGNCMGNLGEMKPTGKTAMEMEERRRRFA